MGVVEPQCSNSQVLGGVVSTRCMGALLCIEVVCLRGDQNVRMPRWHCFVQTDPLKSSTQARRPEMSYCAGTNHEKREQSLKVGSVPLQVQVQRENSSTAVPGALTVPPVAH